MKFTQEHNQIRETVTRFIANEVNPHVKEWEKAEQYPAHEVMGKLGKLGMLGLKYPEEFGGAGLDFSYSMVMAEALGTCSCGGVPMSIGVQTDMATPALARTAMAHCRSARGGGRGVVPDPTGQNRRGSSGDGDQRIPVASTHPTQRYRLCRRTAQGRGGEQSHRAPSTTERYRRLACKEG